MLAYTGMIVYRIMGSLEDLKKELDFLSELR
jgi:hypothetical protein